MDQDQEDILRDHEATIKHLAISVKSLCASLESTTAIFTHYQMQLSSLNQSVRGLTDLLGMSTTTMIAAIQRMDELEHKVNNSQLDWRSE